MPRGKSFDANQHLTKALSAIDAQIAALQAKRNQLATIIGGKTTVAKAAAKPAASNKGKRPMSPEAKAKISAAQKRRWEAAKAEGEGETKAATKKKK